MLYLTVVTPVSLSLWNDTWNVNTDTNKECQDWMNSQVYLKNENLDQQGIQ